MEGDAGRVRHGTYAGRGGTAPRRRESGRGRERVEMGAGTRLGRALRRERQARDSCSESHAAGARARRGPASGTAEYHVGKGGPGTDAGGGQVSPGDWL